MQQLYIGTELQFEVKGDIDLFIDKDAHQLESLDHLKSMLNFNKTCHWDSSHFELYRKSFGLLNQE